MVEAGLPSDYMYVEAKQAGVTYIGGTFCPGETELKAIFDVPYTEFALDVNAARSAVSGGMDVDEAAQLYGMDRNLSGNRKAGQVVRACLGKIAAGNCRVYPRINK